MPMLQKIHRWAFLWLKDILLADVVGTIASSQGLCPLDSPRRQKTDNFRMLGVVSPLRVPRFCIDHQRDTGALPKVRRAMWNAGVAADKLAERWLDDLPWPVPEH